MSTADTTPNAENLTNIRYTETRLEHTGTQEWDDWTDNIFQAGWSHKCPTYINRTPPCQGSCPAGEDIRGWLDIVRGIEKPTHEDMSMQEYAFQRSTNANPFPSVMGRVCPAPCEDGCNRNELDDNVGINSVEQYIGDQARENNFKFKVAEQETGKKVAIIGGGPAGLAAAYQLRRIGHGCTVFDDHSELGGMMMYGIPGYRVPRDMLAHETNRIVEMGVEVKLNTRVGTDITMAELEKDYDAVLWAIGCKEGRGLPIEGFDEAPNCISGVAFLEAFNDGRLHVSSDKVVCIGGGDTSIDVASVARRLGNISSIAEKDFAENVVLGHTAHDVADSASKEGANVTLLSRSSIENMPAAQHEIDDALREGVTIIGCVSPIAVIRDDSGRATALRVMKLEADGKTPIEGSEYDIEATLIVSAIGQKGDMTGIEGMDNGRGFIDGDAHYQVKGKPGHFLAGDIVRPHLLTTAIGQASIASESIHHYLTHGDEEMKKRPKVDKHTFSLEKKLGDTGLSPEESPVHGHNSIRSTDSSDFAIHNYENRSSNDIISHDKLFMAHFAYEERHKRESIDVSSDEVLGHFNERLVALSEDDIVAEAKRCMSCGMCFECDNCVIYCPQDAVHKTPKTQSTTGRYVYTDYDRCIGCHICKDVCPTGYIDMGLGD
ncbi:MAG: NAD(P)-binding protein [gamma proteobacterium symbiont of Taylorina sp.]|nr:NAD(P)-binding protein [gamma proteobacterium symbiont of Taylorina sp.]